MEVPRRICCLAQDPVPLWHYHPSLCPPHRIWFSCVVLSLPSISMLHFLSDLLSLKATLHSQPPCSSHSQTQSSMGLFHRPGNSTWVLSVTATFLPMVPKFCSFRTTTNSFEALSRLSRPCKTDSSKGLREIRVLFMVKQALRANGHILKNPVHASLRWSYFQTSCSCVPLSVVFPRFGHKSVMCLFCPRSSDLWADPRCDLHL